jgi:hypothetical protein
MVLSDAQLAAENDTAWTGVLTGLSISEERELAVPPSSANIGRTKPVLVLLWQM